MSTEDDDRTVFEALGGQPYFDDLAHRFYEQVAADAVLRPLYPEDLEPGERHLALFLGQYWGGPATYNEERGHPRLRMRHAPFAIGQAERDAWYRAMAGAVVTSGAPSALQERLLDYFRMAADHLVNG